MFADTIVKIYYIELGYIPNYPYHMITDKEMIDAFIGEGNYFDSVYPCPDDSLQEEYDALRNQISEILYGYLNGNRDKLSIPNWIYGYMLGNVIAYHSQSEDISYLYDLTGIEPKQSYDIFDGQLAKACYDVSKEWLKKQTSKEYQRVPTVFGEPHVIKSLRLASVDIIMG